LSFRPRPKTTEKPPISLISRNASFIRAIRVIPAAAGKLWFWSFVCFAVRHGTTIRLLFTLAFTSGRLRPAIGGSSTASDI
jgi:hypothetical protein